VTALFADTSALYAAADRREQGHDICRQAYERALRAGDTIVTTEFVIAELHALAIRRSHPEAALRLVQGLTTTGRIDVETVGPARLASAIDLLAARPGRPYSLADAVSFVVMQKLGIRRALTLDADFEAEGFEVLPAA
jgi:predicted nucleic acid-binding protein